MVRQAWPTWPAKRLAQGLVNIEGAGLMRRVFEIFVSPYFIWRRKFLFFLEPLPARVFQGSDYTGYAIFNDYIACAIYTV